MATIKSGHTTGSNVLSSEAEDCVTDADNKMIDIATDSSVNADNMVLDLYSDSVHALKAVKGTHFSHHEGPSALRG
ncbi:hypothetical protein J2Y86_002691 [Pseudomonas migulae]|uniref:hypothetical protein n=1 Tax=Pseudomonas migulae TaxID=78543 RepID=UPI0020A11C88|nr:hypothetical protein [Pseudomonas migulae]MCP1497984.1 hypothetical protein [Pseudomonas migulae]